MGENELDLELVKRVQRGEKSAFDLLVLKYQHRIGAVIGRFVLFAGIAGGVAFVAKKLQGGAQSDNWQSSYNPSPAPTPPPTPSAPQSGLEDTDDPGGASPDEALSDATEEAHPISTPDDPAEVVDLEGGKKK